MAVVLAGPGRRQEAGQRTHQHPVEVVGTAADVAADAADAVAAVLPAAGRAEASGRLSRRTWRRPRRN